jgi:hypothetical protein
MLIPALRAGPSVSGFGIHHLYGGPEQSNQLVAARRYSRSIGTGNQEYAINTVRDEFSEPSRTGGIVQFLDCVVMIGAILERWIEHWPPGANNLGQTVFGKANVQSSNRIGGSLARPLANPKHHFPPVRQPDAGNSAGDMEFYRSLEKYLIDNFEKQKNFRVFLETHENVALDIVQIEH